MKSIEALFYWGNPLPIWKCPDCGKTLCVGSREELKKLSGVYPEDLHKQFISLDRKSVV